MVQAVILAGGESSRFWPLSEGMHKSLNMIMGKTLIQHTIESLKSVGIKDIIVVQGPGREIENVLNDGVRFVVQEEPKGMGDAVLQARDLIKEKFFVLGPDHVDAADFLKPMMDKSKSGAGMVLLGRETEMPWVYGILDIKDGMAKAIVEKPEKGMEPSKVKVVSIYLLGPDFFGYMDKVKKHHYNYEEALGLYMKKNDVPVVMAEKDTSSLKYPWHLFGVVRKLMEKMEAHVADSAKIDSSAVVSGNVHIGENVRIFRNATVIGPCYIGDNSIIGNNSLVREYSNLESGALVGMGAEVTRTIFQRNVHIHSGFFGDSIFGEGCRIGAGTITANVRIDRGLIDSTVKGERTKTGMKSLGVIMGRDTKTGIGVKFMPGVLVGSDCVIGPGTVVRENVDSDTLFYTEFKNTVKRKKE